MRRIGRTFSHRLSKTCPKSGCPSAIAGRFIDHRTAVGCFCSSADKIDHGKQDDLERQADHEQLLIRGWLKPKNSDMQIQLADVIEYPAGSEITHVHHRVDKRERH